MYELPDPIEIEEKKVTKIGFFADEVSLACRPAGLRGAAALGRRGARKQGPPAVRGGLRAKSKPPSSGRIKRIFIVSELCQNSSETRT